jgi:hypothetical protein
MNARQRSIGCCLVLSLIVVTAPAQPRPDSTAKPVPSVRTVTPTEQTRPVPDSGTAPAAALPKIDLPEYVITGSSSIDLAPVEKRPVEASPVPVGPLLGASRSAVRDFRRPMQPAMPVQPGAPWASAFQGRFAGSLGTYFTPDLSLWLGQQWDGYTIDGDATYYRTKGWVANAERTKASLGVRGSTMLSGDSPFIQDTQLGLGLGTVSDRYYFYGSAMPTVQRTISGLDLSFSAQNLSNSEVPYAVSFVNHSRDIADSTWTTTQNSFTFGLTSRFAAGGLPWDIGFRYESATISNFRGGTLSRLDISTETIIPWGEALIRAAVHLGTVVGQGGQEWTRFYPNVRVTVPLTRRHTLVGGFTPHLQFRTLTGELDVNPYLSAQTLIRHTDVLQRWEAGLLSTWSPSVETRVSATYDLMADRPYQVDTAHSGVWDLVYSSRATAVTLRGEMVAKLTANDYLVSGLLVRSLNHSDIGHGVPYDPEAEVGLVYRRQLGEAVTISPSVQFVSRRATTASGSPWLPPLLRSGVHVEYAGWSGVRVTLDAVNLLGRREEAWAGYLDRPFTLALGADIRW